MTQIIKLLFITIFISFFSVNCLLNWKVPLNYDKWLKGTLKQFKTMDKHQVSTFLRTALHMDVSDKDEELMDSAIRSYMEVLFSDRGKIPVEQIRKALKPSKIENLIEKFCVKIYDYLIDYYEIRDLIDEKWYIRMRQNTEIFDMTYDAYLIAKGDLEDMIEYSDEDEDDEDFVQKVVQEIDEIYKEFETNFYIKKNKTINSSGEQKEKDDL